MDNRTIEEVKENETIWINKAIEYEQELDQYKNNWEKLKQFCKNEIKSGIKTDFNKLIESDFKITITCYEFILGKMKELEENK